MNDVFLQIATADASDADDVRFIIDYIYQYDA